MNAELTTATDLLLVERLVIAVWQRQRTDNLLTVRQAARQLGITEEQVMTLAEEADLVINVCDPKPTGGDGVDDAGRFTLEDIMIDLDHLEELISEYERG